MVSLGDDVDLVLKGGGAKGVAYVGAVEVLRSVHKIRTYAGTSAGAIAAALFAVGTDPETVFDDIARPLGIIRNGATSDSSEKARNIRPTDVRRILRGESLLPNDGIVSWLDRMLAARVPHHQRSDHPTCGELMSVAEAGLIVFVSDPQAGLRAYGWVSTKRGGYRLLPESENVPVARVVAASMAIPMVFPAVPNLGGEYYDGGLLANFAVSQTEELLRDGGVEPRVIGLTLNDRDPMSPSSSSKSVFSTLGRVVAAITDGRGASDAATLRERGDLIDIRTFPISTLDLHLAKTDASFLRDAGRAAAATHVGARVERMEEKPLKEKPLWPGDASQTWADCALAAGQMGQSAKDGLEKSHTPKTRPKWRRTILWALLLHYWVPSTVAVLMAIVLTSGAIAAGRGVFEDSAVPDEDRGAVPNEGRGAVPNEQLRERLLNIDNELNGIGACVTNCDLVSCESTLGRIDENLRPALEASCLGDAECLEALPEQ